MTIGAAQARARRTLQGISETSTLDAQLVLAETLDRPRAWVLAHPEYVLERHEEEAFTQALSRMARGEPLAYVLGWWEFYGRRFHVSPSVLIPRPETELLVERALEFLRSDRQAERVIDVGTGSGCVAVTLAAEVPGLRVLATDISGAALGICRRNVREHRVEAQVALVQTDLLACLAGPFDLVLANLPYIPTGAMQELPVARREPGLALDGGVDGLDPLRRMLRQLERLAGGERILLFEIGAEQGSAAAAEARSAFPSASVVVIADLAGRDRVLEIRLD